MKNRSIIACLDIDNRRVVKGRKFEDVKDLADPVELARKYEAEGADVLVFYDISASVEGRGMFLDLIRTIADEIKIPFIVGGGIQTLSDAELAFEAGADRVSINSGALRDPQLIQQVSERYGAENVLLSMDVSRSASGRWNVFAKAGREDTGRSALEWAAEGERLGAGSLVVNCIDEDGMQNGYSLEMTEKIAQTVSVPVIASGGAGRPNHITELFERTSAQGALAASILHYGQVTLQELQEAKRRASPAAVKWDEEGVAPVIIQDAQTKEVLTLAYMNEESLEKTIQTGETWLFSRSRQELWHKGATSGNRQSVREIRYDCDRDAVLLLVDPTGPACHTGSASCFTRKAYFDVTRYESVFRDLEVRIAERKANPSAGSYTTYLLREGIDKILKKVGEEATEVVIGAKNRDLDETANEIADLAYHVLVLMAELGLQVSDVADVLRSRETEKE